MITIKDFMQAVNYRITEGSQYCWRCYGGNAYQLDSWNGDHNGHNVGIVFDTTTQVVYEMNVCDYSNNRAYRWINPDYLATFLKESAEHGINANIAWDYTNYIGIEVAEDILEKAAAVVAGIDYDTRVSVPVDLDDSELLQLALAAHKEDVTLNQYIGKILEQAVKNHAKPQ